jgi:hypothetical protein
LSAKTLGAVSGEDSPLAKPRLVHPGAKKLGIILTIVFAGFMTSLFFHYEQGIVGQRPYPLNTFLFRPDDQFMDFYSNFKNVRMIQDIEKGGEINLGLPSAPLMVYTLALYHLFYPKGMFLAWLLTVGVFIGVLFYLVRSTIRVVSPDCLWAKTLTLTLCSYPVLFAFDRSNFENIIFVLLALAILTYRDQRYLWSAITIGSIIAVKPYAVVFLALFLNDRRFKEIFVAVATAAIWTIGCLLILPGDMASKLAYFHKSLDAYNTVYATLNEGLYFGSSLWGMIKVLLFDRWFLDAEPTAIAALIGGRLMRFYFYFSAAVFASVVALLCLFRMEFWKKAALLICSMNLLPYVCADYRLVHFFIPMLLFLRETKLSREDYCFAAVFGLLMIPTSYIHFVFDPVFWVQPLEVSDSVLLHPALMLMLMAGIIATVLRRPELSDNVRWLLRPFLRRTEALRSA